MITFAGELEIARSREDVFDFLANLDNEPLYNTDASNIRKVTDGPIGLGTVYEEDFRRIGHFRTTIDEYERPSALTFDARSARMDVVVRFRLTEPTPGKTHMRVEYDMKPKGALRLMSPVFRMGGPGMFEKKRAPGLKRALEG